MKSSKGSFAKFTQIVARDRRVICSLCITEDKADDIVFAEHQCKLMTCNIAFGIEEMRALGNIATFFRIKAVVTQHAKGNMVRS